MSSVEIEPRRIDLNSPLIQDCPDYMTVGDYLNRVREVHRDIHGVSTPKDTYDLMASQSYISAALEHGASEPEILALRVKELMEGDTHKVNSLNWKYLKMYHQHWEYGINFPDTANIDLLIFASRFARATGQTAVRSILQGDNNKIEWSGEHYTLDFDDASREQLVAEPHYVSLVVSCEPERLKWAARQADADLGSILELGEFHGIQHNVKAVPLELLKI
jgi:hypothetical protein